MPRGVARMPVPPFRRVAVGASRMRRFTIIAFLTGLALGMALIVWAGYREVGEAFARTGWGVALVVLVRAGVVGMAGLGWWLLLAPSHAATPAACVGIRFIREGINALLPVAQIGGDIAGARLLTLRGVAASLAAASIVTDIFLQVSTQLAFTVLGLLLLLRHGGGDAVVSVVLTGVGVAAPVLVAFYLAQRRGASRLIQAGLRRFAGDRLGAAGATEALYASLAAIQARRGAMLGGGLLHLGAWIIGSLEVYVALHFMGYPIGFAEALIIESLGQAARGAAFAVPGAIGVQEGGFIILGAAFGIPAEPALALSLIKRVADLALGLPGLVAWQAIEGRRALAKDTTRSGEPTRD